MAWSDSEVSDFIESIVNEYNASKYWDADEITLYKKAGMSKVLSQFYPWLYSEKKDWDDLALTSGTNEYAKPTNCYKLAYLCEKDTGEKLLYIPPPEIWKYRDYSAGYPVGWTWKAGEISIIPDVNFTDADYLQIWYMPILDAVTEFPDCCAPLIAIEGAVIALLKDKAADPALMALKKEYEMAVYTDLTLHTMEHIEVFPDYREEDSLA